jgi:hypothetical protein
MKRTLPRSAALLLVPLLLSQGAPALAAGAASDSQGEPAEENAHVRALYRESATLFKSGKSAEARQKLLEAWAIRQTYDVAAALAQVELDLGLDRDAAEHLDFAIRHFAPIESEQTLAQAQQAFDAVKRRVATARVAVDQDGATLLVDGAPIGTTPLPSPVFLAPGSHTLEARLAGNVVSRTVLAAAGEEQRIELTLGATSVAAAAPPPGDSVTETSERSVVPLIVGGATFAVGIGMGIGFQVAASSHDDDAAALREKVGHSGCYESSALAADCAALSSAVEAADRDRAWSTGGFVLAGVSLVATTAYWFLWPESAPTKTGTRSPSVHVMGGALPGAGQLLVNGEF